MYRCVIICKIVRHSLNGLFYFCCISTFFQNHKTLSGMFLSGSKIRIFSISYCLQCSLYRYGVLLAIFYSLYTTDRIRVSLADTFAPESEIFYSATLLYTYISRFSVNPHHRQKRKSQRRCHRNSVPNHSSLRFSTSLTNGPCSLSRVKASTPSASLKESHTTAHTPK